ncbi:MAG: hypothetical protein HUU20_02925 [Pirellulales bacterium]|nr:hypothetical protein [Pirellulales bacterium]
MNLAILHHHLNRGGVARVIENQLRALDTAATAGETWRAAILYGGRREGWNEDLPRQLRRIRLSLHEVPALDYDSVRETNACGAGSLADQVTAALSRLGLSPKSTVVHAHNHSVGKNVALPAALGLLAERGYRLLLEIHDFAEDLRPDNFRQFSERMAGGAPPAAWHGSLYPQARHIHYAVLNTRDLKILRDAGTDTDRIHFLPNPVTKTGSLPPRELARRKLAEQFGIDPDQRFILYPVRCIRRKNVGEALLYSRLAPAGTFVGLTLPPLNPAEIPVYSAWKRAAEELGLPACFEVGAPGALSFAENLSAADLMLTTSVAEGFGMVFLEAWLTGNALVGRDLPEITIDFVQAGVQLGLLEPRLLVPMDWVGRERFRAGLAEAYGRALAAYGRPAPADLTRWIREKAQEDLVDFGDLDEPLQRRVLETACESEHNRLRLFGSNPRVESALSIVPVGAAKRIEWNRDRIEERFSLASSGKRLLAIYRRLFATVPQEERPAPLESPERILDRFLDFNRFRMIRA